MYELQIKIPATDAKNYKIKIAAAILPSLWTQIDADFPKHNKFILTDENLVNSGHLKTLTGSAKVPVFTISPAGESSKNITTVVAIIEAMEKAYLGRDTLLVALGGGTVGDIAGFAAAIFKRGIPVVHIPTTTVAQADSSIGGKTGVDSTISKNAFGAFWHPAAVYIDVETLKTIDERNFRAGLVESVKHALIADNEYFDFLEKNLDAILQRNTDTLEKIAVFNCKIKGSVVEADPTELNKRRILNYGHTIGHAVETASNFSLLHGEAVAIGIISAGLIELELGIGDETRLDRTRNIFKKLGLSLKLPHDLTDSKLIDIMKRDKKALNKWPKFVLIEKIGKIYCPEGQFAVDVRPQIVEKIINRL